VRARISGILKRVAQGRLVGALGGPYGGGLLSFLDEDVRLSEENANVRGRAALSGEGLSVSPSGGRAARSQSAAATPLLVPRPVRVRIRRRSPARALSSVRHNTRRTSGHLRSRISGRIHHHLPISGHGRGVSMRPDSSPSIN